MGKLDIRKLDIYKDSDHTEKIRKSKKRDEDRPREKNKKQYRWCDMGFDMDHSLTLCAPLKKKKYEGTRKRL